MKIQVLRIFFLLKNTSITMGFICCVGRPPFLLETGTLQLVMILGSDPSISSLLLPLSFGDLSYPQSRLHHEILSNNSSIKTSLIEEALYVGESKFLLLQCFIPHSKPVQVLPSFTFSLCGNQYGRQMLIYETLFKICNKVCLSMKFHQSLQRSCYVMSTIHISSRNL